ncbi:MAG TPA: BTAD domain-containing putative transcriptional regulator, partial [Kineosporiaceae bacterium]|nr:BTAD domain-containing putative transcriptional regulator [Kineosporiaceae bacterium]
MHGQGDLAAVTVGLLGPLEVRVGDRPVSLGGQRPRALISLLALSAGRPLSTSRLVDALWEGNPPAAAANTVQVYLSRLRRALAGPDGNAPLRTSAAGYTLDVPDDAVDVSRFERRVAEGHARLSAGDAAGSSRALRSALELWRGPAVPDLVGLRAGEAVIARLDARRLAAQVERIDADAALGRHAPLIPELQELIRLHPLHEGLVVRLMTALYRCGRQAEALAAYAEAATRLAEELGVDPGPQLSGIHGQMLRQEVPGAPAPGPARPPTAAVLSRPRHGLVGRSQELTRALELLADPRVRLVTLLGPGGTGKTRLALEIADRLAERPPPGGVVVVPLSGVDEPAELLAEVCRTLDAVPAWSGEPLLDL